jgi:hypothetical protein
MAKSGGEEGHHGSEEVGNVGCQLEKIIGDGPEEVASAGWPEHSLHKMSRRTQKCTKRGAGTVGAKALFERFT